ncbi:MAG: tetratricopeptide repeat protein, partial [Isosphaeraceae bacterium]
MSRLIGRWLQSLGGKGEERQGARASEWEDPATLAAEVVRLYEAGRYGEAESAARRLVDRQRQTVGERHADFATALSNHGLLLQKLGRLDEAEPPLR